MSCFIIGTKEVACLSGQQNNVLLPVVRNKYLRIFDVAVKTHSSNMTDQYVSDQDEAIDGFFAFARVLCFLSTICVASCVYVDHICVFVCACWEYMVSVATGWA